MSTKTTSKPKIEVGKIKVIQIIFINIYCIIFIPFILLMLQQLVFTSLIGQVYINAIIGAILTIIFQYLMIKGTKKSNEKKMERNAKSKIKHQRKSILPTNNLTETNPKEVRIISEEPDSENDTSDKEKEIIKSLIKEQIEENLSPVNLVTELNNRLSIIPEDIMDNILKLVELPDKIKEIKEKRLKKQRKTLFQRYLNLKEKINDGNFEGFEKEINQILLYEKKIDNSRFFSACKDLQKKFLISHSNQ